MLIRYQYDYGSGPGYDYGWGDGDWDRLDRMGKDETVVDEGTDLEMLTGDGTGDGWDWEESDELTYIFAYGFA